MKDLFIGLLKVAITVIPLWYVCFLISIYIVEFGFGLISLIIKKEKIEKLKYPSIILTSLCLVIEFFYTVQRDSLYYVCIIVLFILLCVSLKCLYHMVLEYQTQNNSQDNLNIPKKTTHAEPDKKLTVTSRKHEEQSKKEIYYNIPNADVYSNIPVELDGSRIDVRSAYRFKTVKGDYVRTSGERIIADRLYQEGILYKYDRALRFQGDTILYPCFTIIVNSNGKRIFWEHLPSMEHVHIQNRWDCIRSLYKQHNIYEGKNLIVTTDDNMNEVDEYIFMLLEIIEPELKNTNILNIDIDLISSNKKSYITLPFDLEPQVYSDYGELLLPTLKGDFVRSRNEQMIADRLYQSKIHYQYEKPIVLEGIVCHPDFTLVCPRDGKQLFWEHCGMMNLPEYINKWERKKKLYERNNIVEGDNLIITYNQISERQISRIIDSLNSYTFFS